MVAATRGLTPANLTAIRDALDAGRKPKVVFTSSAGQMAGNAGHVVELTDPARSDEWIVVQFGKDQLPFSPTDLAVPVRGAATRAAAKTVDPPLAVQPTAKRKPSAPKPAGSQSAVAQSAVTPSVPVPRKEVAVTATSDPVKVNGSKPVNGAVNGAVNGTVNGAVVDTVVTPRPAKTAKPKVPASLVVTLAYADREWTVAASQGSKSLAKPYVIKPTEALRMVALIDVPGVHDAVENIIAAERAEAEHRAIRLREELAEIESRLAELTTR